MTQDNEKTEEDQEIWMNAIVEIIHYSMTSGNILVDNNTDKGAIKEFIEEVKEGNLRDAFLALPIIIWRMCETDDLQVMYSKFLIETTRGNKEIKNIISFAREAVNTEIFCGCEDLDGQVNGAFFLQFLTDMSLRVLQEDKKKESESEI
ncbi:MAG: hypothetical protein KAI57_03270 [Candidatus Pacebacteria bacterium]|nr:hypothetical protein [Candidatus Paceibacterota bacterium]